MQNIDNFDKLKEGLETPNLIKLNGINSNEILFVLGAGFDIDIYKKSYTGPEYNKILLQQIIDEKVLDANQENSIKCLMLENTPTDNGKKFIETMNPKFMATYIDKTISKKILNNDSVLVDEKLLRNQGLTKIFKEKQRKFRNEQILLDIKGLKQTHMNIITTNYGLPPELVEEVASRKIIDNTNFKLQKSNRGGQNIVYFHGNFNSEQKLIYSFDNYYQYYQKKNNDNGTKIPNIKFMFIFGISGMDYPFMERLFKEYKCDYIYFFSVLDIRKDEKKSLEQLLADSYDLSEQFELIHYNKDKMTIVSIMRKIISNCRNHAPFRHIVLHDYEGDNIINCNKRKHNKVWIYKTLNWLIENDNISLNNFYFNIARHINIENISELTKSEIMNEYKILIFHELLKKINLNNPKICKLYENLFLDYLKILSYLKKNKDSFYINANITYISDIFKSIINNSKNYKLKIMACFVLIFYVRPSYRIMQNEKISGDEFKEIIALYYDYDLDKTTYIYKLISYYPNIQFSNLEDIEKCIDLYCEKYNAARIINIFFNIDMNIHILTDLILNWLITSIKSFYENYNGDFDDIWNKLKDISKNDKNFHKGFMGTYITFNNYNILKLNKDKINITSIGNNNNLLNLSRALNIIPFKNINMDIHETFDELFKYPQQHGAYGILTNNKEGNAKMKEIINNSKFYGNEEKKKLLLALKNPSEMKKLHIEKLKREMDVNRIPDFDEIYNTYHDLDDLIGTYRGIYSKGKKNPKINIQKKGIDIFMNVQKFEIKELEKLKNNVWKNNNMFVKFAQGLIYIAYDINNKGDIDTLKQYIEEYNKYIAKYNKSIEEYNKKNNTNYKKNILSSYKQFFKDKYTNYNFDCFEEKLEKFFDILQNKIFTNSYKEKKENFKQFLSKLDISSELFKQAIKIKCSSFTQKDSGKYCIKKIKKNKYMDQKLFLLGIMYININHKKEDLKEGMNIFEKIESENKFKFTFNNDDDALLKQPRKLNIVNIYYDTNKIEDLFNKNELIETILIHLLRKNKLDKTNGYLAQIDYSHVDLNKLGLNDIFLKIPNDIFIEIINGSKIPLESLEPIFEYTNKFTDLQNCDDIKNMINNQIEKNKNLILGGGGYDYFISKYPNNKLLQEIPLLK